MEAEWFVEGYSKIQWKSSFQDACLCVCSFQIFFSKVLEVFAVEIPEGVGSLNTQKFKVLYLFA